MSEQSSLLRMPISKWHRSERLSHDTKPTVLITEIKDDNNNNNDNKFHKSSEACSVCHKMQGRYHCPRCDIAYCSVPCYQKHTFSNSEEGEEELEEHHQQQSSSSACTEAFYKNRVASILQLEKKEQEQNMQQLLRRQYHQTRTSTDDSNNHHHPDENNNNNNANIVVSQDELYDVLLALEQCELEDNSATDIDNAQALQSLLSPSLKAAFESALQSQDLPKLLLQPWYPCWRQELVGNNDHDNDHDDMTLSQMTMEFGNKMTLDERLLNIPPFSSLHKQSPNNDTLRFNLIDILYSIVWTLRLYHGTTNILSSGLQIEAASTLAYSSSNVLSKDVRYTSLEQVLCDCTAASSQIYPLHGCNTHWTILAQDVALLLMTSTSRRHVARALLEAIDIFKAAIRSLKKKQDKNNASNKQDIMTTTTTTTTNMISTMRRIRKKIEFYLSWSWDRTSVDLDDGIGEEITTWIENWNCKDENGNDDDELDHLVIPTTSNDVSQKQRQTGSLNKNNNNNNNNSHRKEEMRQQEDTLLVEVQSIQKVKE